MANITDSPEPERQTKAKANNIWRVPAYLPYVQPPLTEAAVASAETKIGYQLPFEYLNLLKKQNGGYIRYSLPETVHDSIAGIGPYFPSLTGFDWDECQDSVSFPLTGLVPFDGDGHWHLCLDYRHPTGSPAVTYVDIECDQESTIALSFTDYLGKLRIDVDQEYVVEGVSDIEKFKSELSAILGITFDPPNTFAHGYPTHRARLVAAEKPQWLWIGPNVVPCGFVRPNHARYAELKDLMPGFASRFPEAPSDGFILSATATTMDKIASACIQSGKGIHPLSKYLYRS